MSTRFTYLLIVVAAMMMSVPGGATPSLGPEQVVSNQDFDEYLPQVAHNSVRDEYLIVWHDVSPFQARSVMGKRVDRMGSTLDEFVIAFEDAPPRDNGQPTVAYDPVNDRYFVAWVRDVFGNDSDWDVYGRVVPWNGPSASFPAFTICSFTTSQWNPQIAYAGTPGEFMVTWWNEGAGGVNSYISAQRVSSSGSLLGGNFVVASGGQERVAPDLAYNQARNEYLVVYQVMDAGMGSIYGVRISGSGAVLGGGEFGIAVWPDPETMPRVTASRVADEWAVVWQSDVPGSLKDIYARRLWVEAGGAPGFAAPVHVAGSPVDERNPDIAVHPEKTGYLMVWEQQYSSISGPFGIHNRTLTVGNSLGDAFEVSGIFAGQTVDSSRPKVVAAPTDWFVVWEQERDDTPSYLDIHGRAIIGPMFSDGFESGNLSVWDSHSP